MIIEKLSNKLFGEKFDKEFNEWKHDRLEQSPNFDEESMNSEFKSLPSRSYRFGPFEFYGGKFEFEARDKQKMMRDTIYQKQEIEI